MKSFIFAAGKRIVLLCAVCLLLDGCGGNSGADMAKDAEQECIDVSTERESESIEEVTAEQLKKIKNNSLAGWAASLPEGIADDLTAEAVRGVKVVRDGNPLYAVSYEPKAYKNSFDCWDISVPYQSLAVADTEAIYAYFHVLADLELSPADGVTRKQAGVDDSSDTIFVAYYSGQTAEGGQAEPDRGITFRFGSEDGQGNYYVEVSGSIWSVDGKAADQLFAVNPYDCILKVVSVVSVESVSKVTVEFENARYEMESDGAAFRWNGETVDSIAFYELYMELMSIFIKKELQKEEQARGSAGNGELLMSITYERNTEDAPKIVQRYYSYDHDADYAVAQVNGMEYFLVGREDLERLKEKVKNAFSE